MYKGMITFEIKRPCKYIGGKWTRMYSKIYVLVGNIGLRALKILEMTDIHS